MKKFLLALTMLGEAALLPLHAATMASQPWTTNRIAEAEARVNARITSATNAIPAPDYSTGNAQLVATIEATAPAPGDYANVSNRAMSAIQSLEPATNYTDAATNAISSAFLPRQYDDGDDEASVGFDYGPGGLAFVPSELYTTSAYIGNLWIISDDERGPLSAIGQYSGGWKTARDEVEEAIREKSLGGIWDQELGVWWTPVMVNGALTYQATTNVNLSAEANQ